MAIGIDIVNLPHFQKRLDTIGGLTHVFTDYELLTHESIESRAGVFAAKEAFVKALGRVVDWREVWVEKSADGNPAIRSVHLKTNQSAEVSISHDGDYAIAVVMVDSST